MKASDLLIGKIKEFEGFSNTAYRCAAGVWTCGLIPYRRWTRKAVLTHVPTSVIISGSGRSKTPPCLRR